MQGVSVVTAELGVDTLQGGVTVGLRLLDTGEQSNPVSVLPYSIFFSSSSRYRTLYLQIHADRHLQKRALWENRV